MGTDAQRARLFTSVAEKLGEAAADTVMAVLPPWDHHEVARKVDIDNVGVALDAKIDRLDAKVDHVRINLEAKMDRVDSKIDQLQVELNGRMDSLEVMIGAKLDQHFARLLTWTIGMIIAFAGLIIAAANFA